MNSIRDIEMAYANFARDYTLAAKELNPYADCDLLALGNSIAVYSGVFSPVHGVYAAGIDGPLEKRDFEEIELFFQKAEREPIWHLSEISDPSLFKDLERFNKSDSLVTVFDLKNENQALSASDARITVPQDHGDWLLAHTCSRKNTQVNEADLYSSIVLHMKNTRLYLHPSKKDAAFTYFSQGGAIIFISLGTQEDTFHAQMKEAQEYGSQWLAVYSPVETHYFLKNYTHWHYKHSAISRIAL